MAGRLNKIQSYTSGSGRDTLANACDGGKCKQKGYLYLSIYRSLYLSTFTTIHPSNHPSFNVDILLMKCDLSMYQPIKWQVYLSDRRFRPQCSVCPSKISTQLGIPSQIPAYYVCTHSNLFKWCMCLCVCVCVCVCVCLSVCLYLLYEK